MTTTVRERPIIFSDVMVRAILEGRKSQTRRVVKPPKWWKGMMHHATGNVDDRGLTRTNMVLCEETGTHWQYCPFGVPGDRLWAREVHWHNGYLSRWCGADPIEPEWVTNQPLAGQEQSMRDCFVKFDDPGDPNHWRKTPAMFLPRWASRITLEVTSVRAERLQDISEADAKAEGLAEITKDDGRTWKFGIPDLDGLPGGCDVGWPWPDWDVDPRKAYALLWDRINGKRPGCAWADNPFVWAIEFRRIPRAQGEEG